MNNAGVGIGGAIEGIETKKLDMQLDVNLRAVYLVTREAIPMLKEAGARRRRADRQHGLDRGQAAAGLAGRLLGDQGGGDRAHRGDCERSSPSDGVRCTAICPGFVDTPMTDWVKGQVAAERDDPARGRRRGRALPAAALARLHRPRGDDGAARATWRAAGRLGRRSRERSRGARLGAPSARARPRRSLAERSRSTASR